MKVAKVIVGDIDRLTGGYLYQKKLIQYLRNKGVEADVVSIPDMPYILHLFSNLWLLLYFLRKRYDIIIEDELAHPAVWLFNLWMKYVKKTKIVAIVHLLRGVAVRGSWQAPCIGFIEKTMLRSTHLIIANSRHTKQEVEKLGLPSEVIEVVYPGFDILSVPEEKPCHGDEIRLLFVANCDPRKGLETLVEAMCRLNNPKITLDIVGNDKSAPKYTQRIKKRVAAWGLESKVSFQGQIEPELLGGFYSQADIFVLPSLYEPFGIVFAEAMSFGLPIIATDVGGIPELIEHGVNGLLVPPGDAASLAEAIDKLASSTALRQELGRKSYQKSKGLNTWEDCFNIVFDHLKRLAQPENLSR